MERKKVINTVLFIVIIVALVFFAMQGFNLFSDDFKTEKLSAYTDYTTVSAEAYLLREEILLQDENYDNCAFNYLKSDGERVRNGFEIINYYAADISAATLKNISELEAKIASLEALNESETLHHGDALKIEQSIEDLLLEINGTITSGQYSDFESYSERLLNLFNTKQLVLGKMENFDSKLSELKSELENLNRNLPKKNVITAPSAGFFTSYYDGYESLGLTLQNYKSMSVTQAKEAFSGLEPAERPEGYAGKIVTNVDWYLVMIVPSDVYDDFYSLRNRQIIIPDISDSPVSVTIEYKNEYHDECVLILKGGGMSDAFTQKRKFDVQILVKSPPTEPVYKINIKALRMVSDGNGEQTGVYVLVGQQVKFKPVECIKIDENYAVIQTPPDEENKLMENEEIIVGGNDMFDGKTIGR